MKQAGRKERSGKDEIGGQEGRMGEGMKQEGRNEEWGKDETGG